MNDQPDTGNRGTRVRAVSRTWNRIRERLRHHVWIPGWNRIAVVPPLTLALGLAIVATPSMVYADSTITTTQTGTSNGYFYSFWTDQVGQAAMTLSTDGNYSTTWNKVGNFFAGTGWRTGTRRAVTFSATLQSTGNAYVSLYGWTRSPLVEYYIVETWGSYRPTAALLGTVVSDGDVYDIYQQRHYREFDSFTTYWSVRQTRRTSGTITVGNHLDAWARYGMKVGTFDYMIMATEGYQSSGRSSVALGTPPA